MSGGSYNYAYQRVDEMAEELRYSERPERAAFAAHLRLVAKAMHDIEWVDSCDYAKGEEVDAIRAVVSPSLIIETAVERVEEARRALAEAIESASQSGGETDR